MPVGSSLPILMAAAGCIPHLEPNWFNAGCGHDLNLSQPQQRKQQRQRQQPQQQQSNSAASLSTAAQAPFHHSIPGSVFVPHETTHIFKVTQAFWRGLWLALVRIPSSDRLRSSQRYVASGCSPASGGTRTRRFRRQVWERSAPRQHGGRAPWTEERRSMSIGRGWTYILRLLATLFVAPIRHVQGSLGRWGDSMAFNKTFSRCR